LYEDHFCGKAMTKLLRILSLLILDLGLVLGTAQRAVADEDDPPGRAARLGYTQGLVSFEPAGTEDWVSAVVNRPITIGDRLWTDKDARAELNIGSASIRLAGETGFSFLNLTDNMAQIRLSEGVLSIHLRQLDQNEAVEVDTPNLAFNLLRPGDYRLEVNEAGDTTVVTVRGGEGEVTGGGQAFSLHPNQRAIFTGTDQLTADLDNLGDYDDFDRWCRDRDYREDRAPSSPYVSRDVVGYQDLDDYGDWRTVPDYGAMWVPRTVVAGWAPYRYGHWVWISPWGWTWVDDAPWGFAPFHYGRWAFVGGTWGWCPGPVAVVRPIYAPALVAWVGGPYFGIEVGSVGAGVGWFPLGPREVYVPPYRVSRTYVTNVNVTNTTVNNTYVTEVYNNYTTNNTNVTNIKYVNRNAPGAVTATSQTAFATAQPVQRNFVKVDERQLAQARIATNAGVVPQQRSVLGAGTASVRPPAAVQTRAVVARTTPPPPPVAFSRQQQAIQSNGGQPLGRQEAQRLAPQVTQAAAPVRIAQPSAKPVPVESVARAKPNQSQQPNGSRPTPVVPAARPQVAPTQPVQQTTPQNPGIRNDRPPSAQPNRTQPSNSVNSNRPDHPPLNATDPKVEQKLQQQQQKLQQQQQQDFQRLEQKHQQQLQKAQQQMENQRQQQEHLQLQQKQEQQLQKLEQKQQQQRQKGQKQQNPQ
jgi:hypothetical protein